MSIERLHLSTQYNPVEASIHVARYSAAQPFIHGKSVLDIGCGEGYGSHLLKRWGANDVTGIDKSEAAVSQARRLFAGDGVEFVCADVADIGSVPRSTFDVIVCFETIEHVEDPRRLLEAIGGFRTPSTVVIVSCPNDFYYYGRGPSLNQHHLNTWSWYDFRNLAEPLLGPARWYFGAPLSGFGNFECGVESPDDFEDLAGSVADCRFNLVPPPNAQARLTPSSALYYLGIWPVESVKEPLPCAGFGARSDYRQPQLSTVSRSVRAGKVPRIAFVIDREGWAFDNIVKNIEPLLASRYDVSRFYLHDHDDKAKLFADLFTREKFDHVHVMWREALFELLRKGPALEKFIERTGLPAAEIAMRLSHTVITSTVYDHLNLGDEDFEARRALFSFVDGYAVSSSILARIYADRAIDAPISVTEDGVDLDLFEPRNLERFTDHERRLVVGWAGNSAWGSRREDFGPDPKGLHRVIVPAIEELQAEGLDVVGHFADRNVVWRPLEEMPDYYGEIDVLVCASVVEGTPNPVLEAMACGVPVVSTRVGVVPQVFGRQQSRFILAKGTKEELKSALRELYADRRTLELLSTENLDSISGWRWRDKIHQWLRLLGKAEDRNRANRGLKTFALTQILAAREGKPRRGPQADGVAGPGRKVAERVAAGHKSAKAPKGPIRSLRRRLSKLFSRRKR